MITEQGRAQSIAQTFCDEYSKRVILCTNSGSKSIEEICEETGIPTSTCYRRIRALLDSGFLRLERTSSPDFTREHDRYRSTFLKLSMRFENGCLTVEVDQQTLPPASADSLLVATPAIRAH